MALPPEIEALAGPMRQWRHYLHAHPETAFQEVETAAFIAARLREFGLEVHEGIARTGVVGVIEGRADGPWIGLRADIDALDLDEANTFDHRSRHLGRMHGCGHDGHAAMLLGAARYLAEHRDFVGTVAVIFQPAEENEGGARAMIEDGLLDRFPIQSVYGMHNWPGLAAGRFAIRPGPIMAAYDIFEIGLNGQGGHAAMPHLGSDTLVAAAHLVSALQTIPARNVNPLESAVVSVTQIHGGETWNVLPQHAVVRGTVRTFLPEVQNLVERRMGEVVHGIAATFGLTADLRYERRYPATINAVDPARVAAQAAATIVGDDNVDRDTPPSMGSEDFAFLLQARPGAYIRIGAGEGTPLHTQTYDFNDDILTLGAGYWVRLVQALAPSGC